MTGLYHEHGIMHMHGFMTEFVVDEACYMRPVLPSIREAAVLVEPLTIAEKAFIQAEQIQMRLPWNSRPDTQHAVVLGAGPVGLLGAMALRLRVAATSPSIHANASPIRASISRGPSAPPTFRRRIKRRSKWPL